LGSADWATRVIAANEAAADVFWTFRAIYDKHVAALRLQLGDQAFDKAWAEGKTMSMEQSVAYALGEEPLPMEITPPSLSQRSAQPLIEPLSDREIEVLRLIAAGCSNQDIADRLYIGVSTVKKHINHIYDKLDAKNRTQAVAFARERQILTG
jgi:DNA-binding NarL/FixJ family response regulator